MNETSRISWAFAGGKPQGLKVLQTLAERGFVPRFAVAAETLPEDDRGALERLAGELGVDFLASRTMEEIASRLDGLDLLLVCRFELLPREVYERPRLGSVNIHPSLLPKYRGIHPISWALINGEKRTGVTVHVIDDGIDTGPILLRQVVPITEQDNIWTLTAACDDASASLATRLFQHIARKGGLPAAKKLRGRSSYARRRTPEDSRVDWSRSARTIFNSVRALRPPLPPVFTITDAGERISVLDCEVPEYPPGMVLGTAPEGRYIVKTGDSVVLIETNGPLEPGSKLGGEAAAPPRVPKKTDKKRHP